MGKTTVPAPSRKVAMVEAFLKGVGDYYKAEKEKALAEQKRQADMMKAMMPFLQTLEREKGAYTRSMLESQAKQKQFMETMGFKREELAQELTLGMADINAKLTGIQADLKTAGDRLEFDELKLNVDTWLEQAMKKADFEITKWQEKKATERAELRETGATTRQQITETGLTKRADIRATFEAQQAIDERIFEEAQNELDRQVQRDIAGVAAGGLTRDEQAVLDIFQEGIATLYAPKGPVTIMIANPDKPELRESAAAYIAYLDSLRGQLKHKLSLSLPTMGEIEKKKWWGGIERRPALVPEIPTLEVGEQILKTSGDEVDGWVGFFNKKGITELTDAERASLRKKEIDPNAVERRLGK